MLDSETIQEQYFHTSIALEEKLFNHETWYDTKYSSVCIHIHVSRYSGGSKK